MNAHTFFSSFAVKFIHILVVLSIVLTSAISATGVKRAAAQAPAAEGSGLSISGLFSQVVPLAHRRQTLRETVAGFLGIVPGKASWQEVESTLGDDPLITPTDGSGRLPTPTPKATSKKTLTPTSTLTPTETLTPTKTLTPTETLAPTETPEPTLTAEPCADESCFTPTPSSTPTEIPTATPVVTETVPVTEVINMQVGITLTLEATPTVPAPGDIVTLTWSTNLDVLAGRVELRLTLPAGFEPWGLGEEGTYDPTTRELRLPVTGTSGSLGFQVLPGVGGPYALHAGLWVDDRCVVRRTIALPRRGPFKLDASGGHAWGFNRRVEVTFPKGALTEAVDVEVKPPIPEAVPPSLGGRTFEIVALSQATGQEVTQFTRPITIEVFYNKAEIHGDESMLTLFYYDETVQTWRPMTTWVDQESHRLTTESDHLTLFSYKAQDWEAARLPNLEAFQVSSFTGAATYSMQIQVPPGPAGLQPSLSLSYNSQTVDSSASRSQASWVGLGWSLGESYIQRNQKGTPDFYGTEYETLPVRDDDYSDSLCNAGASNNWCGSDGDDTFSLVVNGQSWTLLRLPDNDSN